MKTLLAYHTFSGNTEEVAELILEEGKGLGERVDLYRIGTGPTPDMKSYDTLIIGTFTWDKGSTPDEVKDFAADLGFKPRHVYVFGTGDTQFGGDELFCKAAVKLGRFYETEYPVLKVEQSPRGTQEEVVRKWAKGVFIDRWDN